MLALIFGLSSASYAQFLDTELNPVAKTNITVGEGDAEDTDITFDGNAQDFYIGLDDSADDLVIGLGATVGTTPALAVDENQMVTVSVGIERPLETLTAADTLTVQESGKTVILSSATEFAVTLPAASASAGVEYRIIVGAAPSGASYTVVTDSSENVIIGGINELEVDTGDDGPYSNAADTITFVDSVSVVGDMIHLVCDGTSWFLHGQANADGGITVTQAS